MGHVSRQLRLGAAIAAVLACAHCGVALAASGGAARPAQSFGLVLTAICQDTVASPRPYFMRVRNSGDADVLGTLKDRTSGYSVTTGFPPGEDTFVAIPGGAGHTIELFVGGVQAAVKAANTKVCQGVVTVTKAIAGAADLAPPGPWGIVITGDNGVREALAVPKGGSVRTTLPGTIDEGSVASGSRPPGGYFYVGSEPDPLGASAVSADVTSGLVTVDTTIASTVTNTFTPPVPPIPPVPPDSADLAASVTVVPGETTTGRQVTATVTVRNLGPSTARAVVVDEVPSDSTPASAVTRGTPVPSQGTCTGGRPARCTLGDLAAGATATITTTFVFTAAGVYGDTVVASSPTPDPNPTNNTAAGGVVVDAARTTLGLAVRPSQRRIRPGRVIQFQLRVRNRGRSTAELVEVCDRPPAGTTVIGVSGGRRGERVCFAAEQLTPGRLRTFTYSVRVDRSATPGTVLRDAASASASNAAAVRASAGVRVIGAPPAPGPNFTG